MILFSSYQLPRGCRYILPCQVWSSKKKKSQDLVLGAADDPDEHQTKTRVLASTCLVITISVVIIYYLKKYLPRQDNFHLKVFPCSQHLFFFSKTKLPHFIYYYYFIFCLSLDYSSAQIIGALKKLEPAT